ncbi:MAG: hypothetical protein JNM56_15955 [Planctomycetia bacterium]|nr:hypothetical protein [Planctomycetia bacterium]
MLNTLYWALGASMLLGYSYASVTGWELGDDQRVVMSAEDRALGREGYRRSHFTYWHSGYRGGK